MKLDPEVKKQTKIMLLGAVIGMALEQVVFLLIPDAWSPFVLLSNAIMASYMVLNYLLLGITVQKVVTMEEKEARARMTFSRNLRFLGIIVVLGIAYILVQSFEWPMAILYAMLPAVLYNRITLAVYGIYLAKQSKNETYPSIEEEEDEDEDQ